MSAGEQRARTWGAGPSDDPVGQEVAQRHGDGQSLHLLCALRPAEGHPAQVLQAGDATGTLPEVHATVAGPASKQMPHQSPGFNQEGKTRSQRGLHSPGCKDTSCGGEGTAEAVGQGGHGLGSPVLDAPEPNQPGEEQRWQQAHSESSRSPSESPSLLPIQLLSFPGCVKRFNGLKTRLPD